MILHPLKCYTYTMRRGLNVIISSHQGITSRFSTYNKLNSHKIYKKSSIGDKKQLEGKSSNPLPIAVEFIEDSKSSYLIKQGSSELKQLDEKFEKLEYLLSQRETLNTPGIGISFEESITDEQLEKFVKDNKDQFTDSFGATDDFVEHVNAPPSNTILDTGEQDEFSGDIKSVYLYGSPDPSIPISDTPCAGCGVHLHCQEPSIPGYIPSQKFIAIPKKELRNAICQRCFVLNEYNVALNVSMTPADYLEIVGQIKHEKGLVLLVVDLTDFPNSVFKGLSEVIGKRRQIYVIGNKVDLLPKDSEGYLERTKQIIKTYMQNLGFKKRHSIQHIQLVSAKTGYGIEQLVTKLIVDWNRKGHVFVVGCTNVGKSSLYNALLSSDYCKGSARDHMHKATISNWPGTTLNTLKFPIINPAAWRVALRAKRLKKDHNEEIEERRLKRSLFKHEGGLDNVTLMGRIGQTFIGKKEETLSNLPYEGYTTPMFVVDKTTGQVKTTSDVGVQIKRKVLEGNLSKYDESSYEKSWWCFDTPGVVNPQQIINLLTQEELSIMLTKRLIQPRSFVLKPSEDTLFVSGLGRIDYLKGNTAIYFTVICSLQLPIFVVKTKDADDFYSNTIETDGFKVPRGDKARLNHLPSLIGKEFHLTGLGWQECAADILMSSLGWVAVTAGTGMDVSLRAYVPGGYGCAIRKPALLHRVVNLRGKRKRGTKEYKLRRPML